MRLALEPKVGVVEEDEMVAEEEGVVSSHWNTTDKMQPYNISPNESDMAYRKYALPQTLARS